MAPAPGPPSLLGNYPCQSYAALLCSPGFPDRSGNSSAVSFLGHPWHRQNQMIGIAIHPFFISGNGWKWNDFWEWNTLANLVPSFPSPSHLRNMLDKNCDEMKSMRFCCSCLFKYVCVLETVTPSRGWRLYIYIYIYICLQHFEILNQTRNYGFTQPWRYEWSGCNCHQLRTTKGNQFENWWFFSHLLASNHRKSAGKSWITCVYIYIYTCVYIYIYTCVYIYISLSLFR